MFSLSGISRRKKNARRVDVCKLESLETRRLFASNGNIAVLTKTQEFEQTGPTTVTSEEYEFLANINETADPDGTVSAGSLTLPNSMMDTMATVSSVDESLSEGFVSTTTMDAAFPGGTYTIGYTDNGGMHAIPLTMPSEDIFPDAVMFSNYTALQSANPNGPITIDWDSLGGTSSDYVNVQVTGTDVNIKSPQFTLPGALDGTSTSYTIPADTLTAGVAYHILINYVIPNQLNTAADANVTGISDFAVLTEMTFTPVAGLSAPASPAASQGVYPHHTTISWAAVTGAASYQVYRSTTSNFADANKIAGGVTGTTFSDTGAAPGVLHYYWVVARDGSNISTESDAVSGYTELNAPTGIVATDEAHHVALTWDAAVNAALYQVFRSATNDFNSATRIGTGITTTFFNDTSAVSGTTYFYWIRAKNAVGVGAAGGSVMGGLS